MTEPTANWTPTVIFGIDEAIKRAESAKACCEADAADDLGSVHDELQDALAHLAVARKSAVRQEKLALEIKLP